MVSSLCLSLARAPSPEEGAGDAQVAGQGGDFERSLLLSMALSCLVIMSTYLNSCTETYVAENAKLGLTGKHLRDWITAQIMYADDVRLSKYRAADYLNAGTNEVEAASAIYEAIFPLIEKSSHYVWNLILILYLMPATTPLFFMLIPITLAVQWLRGSGLTRLLHDRQVLEREMNEVLLERMPLCACACFISEYETNGC